MRLSRGGWQGMKKAVGESSDAAATYSARAAATFVIVSFFLCSPHLSSVSWNGVLSVAAASVSPPASPAHACMMCMMVRSAVACTSGHTSPARSRRGGAVVEGRVDDSWRSMARPA